YRNAERCFVQTAIALDPHDADSGAIRLYPGSHRLGDLALGGEGPVLDQSLSARDLATRGLDPADLVDLALAPGDVAMWGLFTVHGSGVNRADHDRRVYINGYVAADDCDLGTWAFRDGAPCPLATD
ncbi:MAG: phytanoyl-CoA dioxygenase family protein, partial [Kiloniellales bacterium]|nr:phytanoyl-CoA dioxygenase family protein [Kiloniellales bacterium]